MEAEDFLEIVYGEREGWIDLPAKVGSYWVPFHTEWPADGTVSRRIDSSLRDREDLYYSVAQFSERGRKIEDVLPSHWLWADLDEVHPTSAAKLGWLPTVAVESSPGRYQGLWRLDRELAPKSLEKLNRALSYALDADRGGWDLTQVLRIPGTRNFKYHDSPVVQLMWYKPDLVYEASKMWAKLKAMLPPEELTAATTVVIPKTGIPARAKVLLRTASDSVVEGERSARLWELECLLAESGLGEEDIFDLIWPCAWNKWRSVGTGRGRLQREIRKAITHVSRQRALKQRESPKPSKEEVGPTEEEDDDSGDEDTAGPEALPWVRYASFMAMKMESPRWLIQDIWTAHSHGIFGGEPKTSKTTIALAAALSVASGKKFLGKYRVGARGPVLFVQEENAPWVIQDKLRKLAVSYGLISKRDVEVRPAESADLARKGKVVVGLDFPRDVPLKILNNYGFDLGLEEHRDLLWEECASLRPALVVLDPLYLILGGADENRTTELRPFLKWLLALRYEFDTAIMVIHHMRKRNLNSPSAVRAGQNLMGSAILHGWVDSALYASAREIDKVGWTSSLIEREFRSMAPQRPMEVDWNMGQPGDLTLEVQLREFNLGGLIAKRVKEESGITVKDLAEALDMDKRTLLARVRGGQAPGVVVQGSGPGRGRAVRLVWEGDDEEEE